MAAVATTRETLEAEAWGDYVNPLGFLYDDPNFGFPVGPVSLVGDRDEGQEQRLIENEVQLAAIRGQARVLSWSTPYGRNVLRQLKNYNVGVGCEYLVQPAKRVKADQLPAGLVAAVQHAVDCFLDDNNWCGSEEKEGETLARAERDGEAFVALSVDRATQQIVTRFIDPEQIVEPKDSRGLEDFLQLTGRLTHEGPVSWKFGIATPLEDVETTLGYHVQWDGTGTDYEFLDRQEVEHLKLNTDSNVKRGVSSFFGVLQDLQREAKLRKNTVVGASLQAAIAWIREHATGTTGAQVEGILKPTATFKQPVASGGTREVKQATYNAGSIVDVGVGRKYVAPPMGSERIPNFIAIAAYVLRAVGVNWQMPEYMVSGDASNANYASTLVAESPFTKAREADQRFYTRRFRNLVWKMLRLAWRVGRFSGFGLQSFVELERLLEIVVTPPAVASRNRAEETTRNAALSQAGLLSRRTWAQREELDWDEEQRNIAGEPRPAPEPISPPAPAAGLPVPSVESLATAVTDKLFAGLRKGEQWEGYP